MDRQKIERSIKGLSEWQMHVQAESDIDTNISTAIEALKAQLSREGTTSDLISRQWLLDCINEGWIKFDTDKDANRFIHLVRDIAPSTQPEPHEGEWIPVHPLQSDDSGAYMCSKCKTGMWEIRPSSYHYCPNCGAKMKGAEHETD